MLVLCDGGCDVLLTGLESGLATPSEESARARRIGRLGGWPETWRVAAGETRRVFRCPQP